MFQFKAIKPGKQFKSSIFRDYIKTAANEMAPKIKADFEKTTKTWADKPKFEVEVRVGALAGGKLAKEVTGSATGVSVGVFTDDAIYGHIDEGTKVRYATMSRDFQAKTKPKFIGSGRGRGKLLFVNKKRPRPGIKARQFSKVIHDKWQKPFRDRMQQALTQAAAGSGHGLI